MADFKYPLRVICKQYNLVVEFTSLKEGTVISSNTSTWKVGWHSKTWFKHTDPVWEPLEISKRIQLHNLVKDYKC